MSNTLWLILAAVVLAVAAGLWAWQRHRMHLSEIQRKLAWSEASRFQLEEHARSVDLRLAAMSEVLQSQQQALQASTEAATRRAMLDELIDRCPAEPMAVWADTVPLGPAGPPYAETMPAELAASSHTRPATG